MRLQSWAPVLIASFSVPGVLGWGAAGHEIVATIAQIHLHPTVFPHICSILNFTSNNPNEPLCHLAPIATWADRIRWKMRWSASLHYVGAVDDYPSQTCEFPGQRGWAGKAGANVLGAVRNDTAILEEWVGYNKGGNLDDSEDDRANEALKFLVHFLGDMHMPLHLTGRDRGGNSVKVAFGGRQTNLHSLWDGLLIAKALRTIPYNYTRPLPSKHIEYNLRDTIYDPYVRRVMWEGILGKWRDEVPSWLACPSSASEKRATVSSSASTFGSAWQQVVSLWEYLRNGEGVAADTDDDILCPYHWATPIHDLNCDIIWPKELDEPPYVHHRLASADVHDTHSHSHDLSVEDELASLDGDSHDTLNGGLNPWLELDTPEYSGVIANEWIVEKLMAQAGIRLAGVLNYLFADDEDERLVNGLRIVEFDI